MANQIGTSQLGTLWRFFPWLLGNFLHRGLTKTLNFLFIWGILGPAVSASFWKNGFSKLFLNFKSGNSKNYLIVQEKEKSHRFFFFPTGPHERTCLACTAFKKFFHYQPKVPTSTVRKIIFWISKKKNSDRFSRLGNRGIWFFTSLTLQTFSMKK